MLARSASDAGTRLRRSKSTSTVHRPPPPLLEPQDPEVAQQHALAAAATAYVRAHGNASVDRSQKRSSDLSRTKSTSSRKSITSQGSHFPPRESSFRSSNPPRIGHTAASQRQSRSTTTAAEKFPPFHPAPEVERPLSAQTSITFNENVRPSSQSKIHRQSAASSITSQQIRKARSMYYASSVQTGSPIARPPVKYLTSPPQTNAGPASNTSSAPAPSRITAPSPLALPQLPVAIEPGETIDKARDKYLQGFQERQVKHKPSLFLAPFKKRQDKTKKKERPLSAGFMSVSSGSRQTPSDFTNESLDDFGMPKQKKEKRSFSGSIRDKIKKVFRRTSNHSIALPVQQIEASRDYVSYATSQHVHVSPTESTPNIPSPDDETLMRVRARTPMPEKSPFPFTRPTSRGSIRSRDSSRSLHSEANLTQTSSRVTSWGESSASGTLTQRDIKRLTVIHEAKSSIGSDADRLSLSSVRRKSVPLPNSTAFKEPMHMESLIEESTTPVDPKRVFSALMRQIDSSKASRTPAGASKSSPSAESDVFESSATKELYIAPRELHSSTNKDLRSSISIEQRPGSRQRPVTAKSKASSVRSFGRALKSTIRAVTPTDKKTDVLERTTSVRGAVRIPRPDTATTESSTNDNDACDLTGRPIGSINFRIGGASRPTTRQSHHEHHDYEVTMPSADLIEQRVARSKERWKTPLDGDKAAFPSQDISYFSRSARGEYPSQLEDGSPKAEQAQVTTPMQTTPISPRSPKPRQLFSPLSPSIYSRNTDGASIFPNDSVASLGAKSDDDGAGSAIITTSRAIRKYAIGTPSPHRNTDSTQSSRDWKEWLSHEVSELGAGSRENIAIDESYSPQAKHHRREFTQIDEDDNKTIPRPSMDMPTPRPGTVRLVSKAVEEVGEMEEVVESVEQALPSVEFAPTAPAKSSPKEESPPEAKRTPLFSKKRLSSIGSGTSSRTHSSTSTPKSSHMNERFPFLNTGRRSSSSSAMIRRVSRTPTEGSSGSSQKSKAATPSPKVYSDFSTPGTNKTSRHDPNTRSSRMGEILSEKENVKQDASPPPSKQSDQTLGVVHKVNRPRSMLPLSSAALNRSPSSLSQYTTTAEDSKMSKVALPVSLKTSPQRQRMRLQVSPTKLTMRPRSAFDLRGGNTPPPLAPSPLNHCPGIHVSPKRAGRSTPENTSRTTPAPAITAVKQKRASYRVSALDNETLRTLIESPWALSGGLPATPRESQDLQAAMDGERRGGSLEPHSRATHNSSQLALSREPVPSSAGGGQGIDSMLGAGDRDGRREATRASASGRITPGQMLAERFLRERSVAESVRSDASGWHGDAASLASGYSASLKDEGMGKGKVEREDTPAFL